MNSAGRSEFVVDGYQNKVEEDLSDLMHNLPEPYISVLRTVQIELKSLAETLGRLSLMDEGDIRNKLNEIIRYTSKMDVTYYQHKNALKNMIDEAIITTALLIAELDKLLNLEEEIHKKPDERLN